jgi:hypothetical protein
MSDTPNLIGATVTVTTDVDSQTNYNIIGEGLCSDQSNTLIFGLDDAKTIQSIRVKDNKGTIQVLDSVLINTTIVVGK